MLAREEIASLRELVKNIQSPMLVSIEQLVVLVGKISSDVSELQKDFLRMGAKRRSTDEPE